ncbi:hypothetical protein TrVE_jg5415 [Triparma verrucosa]|uniref:Uncharacterized protein n=2 Tax=Triparma TaxID=722752 RepID=A0A9W7EPH2_9STRA|nr:hypothetical protein TrST_g10926 [Triparma strigata]GMI12509.1 hypothetical protein TrVE_jg5415 [Triparma verrucosa]
MAWVSARKSATKLLSAAPALMVLSSANCGSFKFTSVGLCQLDDESFKSIDYPKLGYGSDLYIKNPKVSDLRILYSRWASGSDVWPWIWCHRNANGPHHVFVLSSTDLNTEQAKALLQQIERLAKSSPNNNIVVIVDNESKLASAPGSPGLDWFYKNRCGLVEGRVKLFDADSKILMLDDERVIAFDSCSIASEARSE